MSDQDYVELDGEQDEEEHGLSRRDLLLGGGMLMAGAGLMGAPAAAAATHRASATWNYAVITHGAGDLFYRHIRVDAMRREVPGLGREPHSNIAADLPDPHGALGKPQRRKPEPQVQPLIDRAPGPLQCHILAAAEQIQRADR